MDVNDFKKCQKRIRNDQVPKLINKNNPTETELFENRSNCFEIVPFHYCTPQNFVPSSLTKTIQKSLYAQIDVSDIGRDRLVYCAMSNLQLL